MDAVDDRRNGTSLLPGHRDLTPNSDAARLRLDPPTTVHATHLTRRTTGPCGHTCRFGESSKGPVGDHHRHHMRPASPVRALKGCHAYTGRRRPWERRLGLTRWPYRRDGKQISPLPTHVHPSCNQSIRGRAMQPSFGSSANSPNRS
jgi:hypothetical protein